MTSIKQARQDVEHYGFVVDRRKALCEQFPTYARVKRESPLHPEQRERKRAWLEAMGTPEARAITSAAERQAEITRWQEAEADRFIAEQRKKHPVWPVVEDPDPDILEGLAREAVANLRARYGGPSTFQEDK